MNAHQNRNWLHPVDFSRPPPGRPPGQPPYPAPNIPQSFSVPPPNRVAPLPIPHTPDYFSGVVANPYADPRADDALRHRALSTRFDWNHNPDLQNKFSDSEFSDNSIASTDGFVRTTGFRHGNAVARGKKLKAMNERLDAGIVESNSGKCGVVSGNTLQTEASSAENRNRSGADGNTRYDVRNDGLKHGRGRGLRNQLPSRPGHKDLPYAGHDLPRSTESGESSEGEAVKLELRAGDPHHNVRDGTNGDVPDGRYVPNSCFNNDDNQSFYGSHADPDLISASYSLNTDIRNAQDVTARHSGVAFLHDASSDIGEAASNGNRGRRFVASAHKRYEVIGEFPSNGETEDRRAAALNSLLVQLTSKAKRRDADGREYYIRDEIMPFDEDQYHEFKGHRSMAYDEQPVRSRASASKQKRSSRKPVSLALNAFLNSQCGGTIYLGVLDTGAIKGLMLTAYQKDHVRLQVKDLFSRYEPTVPSHRYQLTFVPVLEGIDLETEIATLNSYDDEPRMAIKANKKHQFRTPHYCWCDKDAVALLEFGRIPSQYIIEVEIFPWNPNHPKNPNHFGPDCPNIAPVYEDEMGRVSFRRNASNYSPLVSEVLEYAKHQVDQYYLDLIDALDLEEDDGEDDGRELIFDDTPRDKAKTRLGLNVMEKTVKSLKRNGTWDPNVDDDDDLRDHVQAQTIEEEPNLLSVNAENKPFSFALVDDTLASEIDRLLEIGDQNIPAELKPNV